jgi:hypothetical protein
MGYGLYLPPWVKRALTRIYSTTLPVALHVSAILGTDLRCRTAIAGENVSRDDGNGLVLRTVGWTLHLASR